MMDIFQQEVESMVKQYCNDFIIEGYFTTISYFDRKKKESKEIKIIPAFIEQSENTFGENCYINIKN